MKDLAKQYPMLTADERFRLFVEAVGRKDAQELDPLEATCCRPYEAQVYEYTRTKTQFTILAFATAIQKRRIELLAPTALVIALATEGEMLGRARVSSRAQSRFIVQKLQSRYARRATLYVQNSGVPSLSRLSAAAAMTFA